MEKIKGRKHLIPFGFQRGIGGLQDSARNSLF